MSKSRWLAFTALAVLLVFKAPLAGVIVLAVIIVSYAVSCRVNPRAFHGRCNGTGRHNGTWFSWSHRRCGGCQSGRIYRWGAARVFGSDTIKAQAARQDAALKAARRNHTWR
jgi:hypothetical protein